MQILHNLRLAGGRLIHMKRQHAYIREQFNQIEDLKYHKGYLYWMYFDTFRARIFYGMVERDYFVSEFYKKSSLARRATLLTYKRFPFRKKLQYPEGRKVFTDKRLMCEKFKEEMNRDILFLDDTCDYTKFKNFLDAHNSSFIKPVDGYGGKGIIKVSKKLNDAETKNLYNSIKENFYIVEETVEQVDEIKQFNPNSLNTFRIMTIISDNGEPIVTNAVLRIACGEKYVDNFSSGGIGTNVDVETGILSPGFDPNLNKYYYHPVTHKQIAGYKIPEWDKYVAFAKQLALKDPKMRYMGWDIVQNKNGEMVLIEGNDEAGFDVIELSTYNTDLIAYRYERLLKDGE